MIKEAPTLAYQFSRSAQIVAEKARVARGLPPTLFYDEIAVEINFNLSYDEVPTEEPCEVIFYKGFTNFNEPITAIQFPDGSSVHFVDKNKTTLQGKN